MRALRPILLAATSILAISATATHAAPNAPVESSRRAAILPEVQKHLDDARGCALNGTPAVAAAHADLILVGDEIKYTVQWEGVPQGMQARSLKALTGALDAWEKALDDSVTFREVKDPAQANILVRFKPGVMMGKEPVAGFANWKRSLLADGPKVQSIKFTSDLQIRTINLDGQPMPMECVRHEICHEVGHILGLEDSDSTGDLMGPLDVNHPINGPRSYEASAVKRLREDAQKIRTDALGKMAK